MFGTAIPMKMNWAVVLTLGWVGIMILQDRAFAFPQFDDVATRVLIEAVLRTDAGAELASALLGPNVRSINPGAPQELIDTLLNPANHELAESFGRRLELFRGDVAAAGGLEQMGEEALSQETSGSSRSPAARAETSNLWTAKGSASKPLTRPGAPNS
jgi:hypothetical protein